MQPQHILSLVVALIAGYVLARYYPQLGQTVGLP